MTPSGSSSPAFATQSVGITVAHLTKTFGSTTVLRDINFSVKPGEIFALMDEGEVLLKTGDVLVQRGTNHAWSNRTTQPAVIAFVLIDAEPV